MAKSPIFDKRLLAIDPAIRKPMDPGILAVVFKERRDELERIIGGTADFLPFSFLEKGMQVGRAVTRIEVTEPTPFGREVRGHGTGFLISPNLLMTNHHVLPEVETARNSRAQFNYEMDSLGNEKAADDWDLDPEHCFITSPYEELDFTIVAVAPKNGAPPGATYGFVPLRASRSKVMIGEPVNILQHPNGRRKEVVLQENKITAFYKDGYIHYVADTLKGSSGSPVFNNQWDIVALHHTGVYKRDENGDPVIVNDEYVYIANEGVRISSIVEHLRSSPAVPEAMRQLVVPNLFP